MTFFQGQMAFTRCILFTRFTREQNTTCKGHLAFQKVIYSRESAIHSFSYPNIHSFYYECRKGTMLWLPFSQKHIATITRHMLMDSVWLSQQSHVLRDCFLIVDLPRLVREVPLVGT